MCTYVCTHAPVGVDTYKAKRGHQIPGNYIHRQLSLLVWVLGLKFYSSARVASAPNHRARLSLLVLHCVKNLKHFFLFTQDTIWNRTNHVAKNRQNQHTGSTFWSSPHSGCVLATAHCS